MGIQTIYLREDIASKVLQHPLGKSAVIDKALRDYFEKEDNPSLLDIEKELLRRKQLKEMKELEKEHGHQ